MKINECLINWYNENKRDLVFRKMNDPYAIWVSEIMAQQTRIDSMIPYFNRWMERFPTIDELANAPIGDVLKLWQGLGYYNRARKIHEGAKILKEKYVGKLPNDLEELKKIPGIGFYTSGAIASIAFGLRAPAVDGNVLRVTTRMLKISDDITKKTTVDKIYKIVYDWMEESDASSFTQGLMEIGALVCTPKSPSCMFCPLNEHCLSVKDGTQMDYPVKKVAKKATELFLNTYFIINDSNQVLISQDWSDGLMKGLYRLPQFESIPECLKEAELKEKRKHIFSHRIWNMNCYVLNKNVELEHCFWVNLDELQELTMVTAHKKWLNKLMEEKL